MGNRWDTARTEAFSDGVFAIAITLLVLEISVPHDDFDNLWLGIFHQWPAYLAYVTSFMTIGGIWLAHHGVFRRLQYVDNHVMRLNLVLLMAVSFLPFPTKLVAEAIHDVDAERVAVTFYGACLLTISILFAVLWGWVAKEPELLKPEVTETEIEEVLKQVSPAVGFYIGATALAVVAPRVSAFLYLGIAVLAIMRVKGDVTSPAAPERPAA